MLGDQGRALRIISINKGWDPTKIQGGGDIGNFDKSPDGVDHKTVGKLPQAIPPQQGAFPEDHPRIDPNGDVPWNHGNANPNRDENFDLSKPPTVPRNVRPKFPAGGGADA